MTPNHKTIVWHGIELTLLYHHFGLHSDNWAYIPTPPQEDTLSRGAQYPHVRRALDDDDPRPWIACAHKGASEGRGWTPEEACATADLGGSREMASLSGLRHNPYTISLGNTDHSIPPDAALQLFIGLLRCFRQLPPWVYDEQRNLLAAEVKEFAQVLAPSVDGKVEVEVVQEKFGTLRRLLTRYEADLQRLLVSERLASP